MGMQSTGDLESIRGRRRRFIAIAAGGGIGSGTLTGLVLHLSSFDLSPLAFGLIVLAVTIATMGSARVAEIWVEGRETRKANAQRSRNQRRLLRRIRRIPNGQLTRKERAELYKQVVKRAADS